jgi:hypothetical protein
MGIRCGANSKPGAFFEPSDYPIREAEDEERTKNEIHNERKSGVQRSG